MYFRKPIYRDSSPMFSYIWLKHFCQKLISIMSNRMFYFIKRIKNFEESIRPKIKIVELQNVFKKSIKLSLFLLKKKVRFFKFYQVNLPIRSL